MFNIWNTIDQQQESVKESYAAKDNVAKWNITHGKTDDDKKHENSKNAVSQVTAGLVQILTKTKKFVERTNFVFKLHYRFAFFFFLFSTALVWFKELIGEHIRCMVSNTNLKAITPAVETYCFFTSTFTVVKYHNVELYESHPGIGPYNEDDEIIVYAYYQWVPYVLLLQALFFYAPWQYWKFLEDGRILKFKEGLSLIYKNKHATIENRVIAFRVKVRKLVEVMREVSRMTESESGVSSEDLRSLEKDVILIDKELLERNSYKGGLEELRKACEDEVKNPDEGIRKIVEEEHEKYVNNLRSADIRLQLRGNNDWTVYLIVCELLCFCNVILQLFMTDWFLGGRFWSLGVDFMESQETLDLVFPKVTKCNFRRYGQSGTIETRDALCVMALNIINEKIYVVLWWWLPVLIICTGMLLVWRLISFALHYLLKGPNTRILYSICEERVHYEDIRTIVSKLNYSEWILLRYMVENLKGPIIKDLLTILVEDLKTKNKEKKKLRKHHSTSESSSDISFGIPLVTLKKGNTDEVASSSKTKQY